MHAMLLRLLCIILCLPPFLMWSNCSRRILQLAFTTVHVDVDTVLRLCGLCDYIDEVAPSMLVTTRQWPHCCMMTLEQQRRGRILAKICAEDADLFSANAAVAPVLPPSRRSKIIIQQHGQLAFCMQASKCFFGSLCVSFNSCAGEPPQNCGMQQVKEPTCCQWAWLSCLLVMMRDSHLTERAPVTPGTTTLRGNPWSVDSVLHTTMHSVEQSTVSCRVRLSSYGGIEVCPLGVSALIAT